MNKESNTVSLQEAYEMLLEELRNPTPPKPCKMCGKLTKFDAFKVPICYPYGEDGQVVSTCKWDYADKRRKENWQ